ncbi:hypothetical protein EDC01DRAFT_780988 [Geopyxis carbonaria]|nr:hypothetical protein EDC01DRAFT_780988 [Geopyxis carbonaria]
MSFSHTFATQTLTLLPLFLRTNSRSPAALSYIRILRQMYMTLRETAKHILRLPQTLFSDAPSRLLAELEPLLHRLRAVDGPRAALFEELYMAVLQRVYAALLEALEALARPTTPQSVRVLHIWGSVSWVQARSLRSREGSVECREWVRTLEKWGRPVEGKGTPPVAADSGQLGKIGDVRNSYSDLES